MGMFISMFALQLGWWETTGLPGSGQSQLTAPTAYLTYECWPLKTAMRLVEPMADSVH
jgi:hypothetical protein